MVSDVEEFFSVAELFTSALFFVSSVALIYGLFTGDAIYLLGYIGFSGLHVIILTVYAAWLCSVLYKYLLNEVDGGVFTVFVFMICWMFSSAGIYMFSIYSVYHLYHNHMNYIEESEYQRQRIEENILYNQTWPKY